MRPSKLIRWMSASPNTDSPASVEKSLINRVPPVAAVASAACLLLSGCCSPSTNEPIAIRASGSTSQPDEIRIATPSAGDVVFRRVEGASFRMGNNRLYFKKGTLGYMIQGARGPTDQGPERDVSVQTFYLAVYQVTVAQYCEFLNQASEVDELTVLNRFTPYRRNEHGRWIPSVPTDLAKSSGPSPDPDEVGRWPATCVPYLGAIKFCEWLSQKSGHRVRLPTEAEWEFAARGSERRRYPWGDYLPSRNDREGMAQYFGYGVPLTHLPIEERVPRNVTPHGIRGLAAGIPGDLTASLYTEELGEAAEQVADLASWYAGAPRTVRGIEGLTGRNAVVRGIIEQGSGRSGFRPLIEISAATAGSDVSGGR